MTWREIIHGGDPYKDFPHEKFAFLDEGWGHESSVFEDLIKQNRPSKIIEVGSWVGASAIRMAELMEKYEIDGEIVCVDTWLGTADNWMVWVRPIGNFGRPLHYYQFMTNVIRSGQTERIIPLPLDSLNAARFFRAKKMQADMIYIDAGHDYDSVSLDIRAYWWVLRPGGVMVGDDYSEEWPGVVKAVDEFSIATGCYVNRDYPGKWMAQKP